MGWLEIILATVFLMGIGFGSPGCCCEYPDVECPHCTDEAGPGQYALYVEGTITDGDDSNANYCWGHDKCAAMLGTFFLTSGPGFGECCWTDVFNECSELVAGDRCPTSWSYCLREGTFGDPDRRELTLSGCTGEVSPAMIRWYSETTFPVNCKETVTDIETWSTDVTSGFDRCTLDPDVTLELEPLPGP